ncbi:hypothetical protein BXZ70DRAFT_996345 [Cristinia sonorae]|uniref:MYND-type domain-containing protein n=1 Tax=Cristinia sonorae TaxID=1940300 RepID=A0A8K0UDZ4_9AGAR|nr:hypothetical protein BXZ70DRAFT_996345 [Cristinia sonorae]
MSSPEDVQFNRVLQQMRKTPKRILEAAKKGGRMELTVLSNAWVETPGLIDPSDALDVWLHHLNVSLVPTDIKADKFCDRANSAFCATLGLSKLGSFLTSRPGLVQRLVDAWPGIFKWTVFLVASRVEDLELDNRRRKATLDVISLCWYTLAHQDLLREIMVQTPATIEIATRLWIEEDKGLIPSSSPIHVGSCALGELLKMAKKPELDRMLKAKGGKADEIAKLSMTRLKTALKSPQPNAASLMIYMDFINSLSRVYSHPLRRALLSANVIWVFTGALVKLSVLVNTANNQDYIDAMVSGFGYLRNCLESSDGFTWVSQSVGAGLLPAFCDCSPLFKRLDPEDLNLVTDIIDSILPRYLVYRSVIDAVDHSMAKLSKSQRDRVGKSIVAKKWDAFYDLAYERKLVLLHNDVTKGRNLTCDNIKCQKVKSKEEVRRCSACLTTFYCSKECQTTAWKEGDHKTMCKLKERERMEGKSEAISRKDAAFFHVLFMRDARKLRYDCRKIMERDYPSASIHDFVIYMDYTVVPMKHSVKLLKGFDIGPTAGTDNAEARNEALVEKVQQNPTRFTLVESKISCGSSEQCVLTLATAGFWEKGSGLEGETEEAYEGVDDEEDFEPLDHIDLLKARFALDAFVRHIEGPGSKGFPHPDTP